MLDPDVSLGHTFVDTSTTVGIITTTTRKAGASGKIGLTYDLPNASAAITAKTNQDGTRLGFKVGLKLDLRHGSFSADLGVTRREDQNPEMTASLSWLQELSDGQLGVCLRCSVSTDSSDTGTLATELVLGYHHGLIRNSGLNFNLS